MVVVVVLFKVVARAEKGEGLPESLKVKLMRPSWAQAVALSVAAFADAVVQRVPWVGPRRDAAATADAAEAPGDDPGEDPALAAKRRLDAQQQRTFRVTFVASIAFFTVRILWAGHVGELAKALWTHAGRPRHRRDGLDSEAEDMYGEAPAGDGGESYEF